MTVDDLRKKRKISQVAFTEFTKHIRQDKNGLFCFFEGNDAPYYQVQIRRVYEGNYYPISCGNKVKVLETYNSISQKPIYDKYKKGFFIDRDFDPLENNPAIYETPCYSIENLYVSPTVFSEILKNELQLTEVSESYENAMVLYEKLLNEFLEATTLFNAWYACQVDWKYENKEQLPFSLGRKMAINFVTVTLEKVGQDDNFETLKQKFPKAIDISEEVLSQKVEAFNQVNKQCVFRGKGLIKFMTRILEQLIENSQKEKNIITQRLKYGINQNQEISQFAQYAETPQSLTEYLEQVLN